MIDHAIVILQQHITCMTFSNHAEWSFASVGYCCARQAWLSYEAMPMVDDNGVRLGTSDYANETLPR